MKTITLTRTVTEKQEVQVPINEVKHTEIMGMTNAQLRSYASAMRMLMKDTFNTGSGNTEHPQSTVDDHKPSVKHDNASHKVSLDIPEPVSSKSRRRMTGDSPLLGKKTGKTSKYHFVFLGTKSGQYSAAIKRNGKSAWLGSHKDPRMLAMKVDGYLDGVEDKKRPRNRDEFPEIAELYKPELLKDNK